MTALPDDFDEERINAPRGYWKDGLFDCFSLGLLHSSLICGFCCTQSKYICTVFLPLGKHKFMAKFLVNGIFESLICFNVVFFLL